MKNILIIFAGLALTFLPARAQQILSVKEQIAQLKEQKKVADRARQALQFATIQSAYSKAQAYHTGSDGEKNVDKAIPHYEKAAALGDTRSEFNLGMIYSAEKKEYEKGNYWFKKAADKGHAGAQYNLSLAYAQGDGVSVDALESIKWLLLAKKYSNNNEQVIARLDQLKSILPISAFQEAENRVVQWEEEFSARKTVQDNNKPELEVIHSGKATNYNVKGSLQPTENVGCSEVSALTNKTIPPNIFLGAKDCLLEEDFKKAQELLFLARLFGIYDGMRITDRTAAQGITVMQMNIFNEIPRETIAKLRAYQKEHYTKGSPAMNSFCKVARKIGKPDYYPKYLVLHGIAAFTGIEGDGLKENFEGTTQWNSLLDKNCP